MKLKQVRRNARTDYKPILFIAGLMLLTSTFYLVSRLFDAEKNVIPLTVVSLLAGALVEGRRIIEKWSSLFYTAIGAFLLSFIAFFPGKKEYDYDLATHIQHWPYFFLGFFVLAIMVIHQDKLTPRLTEGITLLQTIAAVYWVLDLRLVPTDNPIAIGLLLIGFLFIGFTLLHALTHLSLSRGDRLVLSIWSSIIMVLFAADNIYRIYQNPPIETLANLPVALYITLQYFLLGTSSLYLAHNCLMVFGFLPGKGTFFNRQYFRDIKELADIHIKRYSDNQVNISHSFLCLLLTGAAFYLNYQYQLLPRHLAIWLVFVTFPYMLRLLMGSARSRY